MEYSFQYTITEEEYADFAVYAGWSAPWLAKSRRWGTVQIAVYAGIMIFAVLITLNYLTNNPLFQDRYVYYFLTALVILTTIVSIRNAPATLKNKARKFIQEPDNNHLLDERQLILNDEGISATDENNRIFSKWDSIKKIAVTKDYFFLFINSQNAHLIPKRLLSSQKEIDELDKFLTEKIPIVSSFRSLGYKG